MARFTREAQVLASLNHPNIGAIHGLEEEDGVRALVLELIEGEDLSERIAKGPIPLEEALQIALQITEALEAAHEKGIIHRDLKPANVKITPEGQIKVLDFGLAKAMEEAPASSPEMTHSPTLTMQATQAGMILGTAAYMSPEQARGRSVDKRTDIWAFGVVFYEMLAGESLFSGESVTDILAGVVQKDPDWDLLPASTPAAVCRLLVRCLNRDANSRLRDAGDARLEILDSQGAGGASLSQLDGKSTNSRLIMAVASIAAIVAIFSIVWERAPTDPGDLIRFKVELPSGFRPTSDGQGSAVALSPDGQLLVLVLQGPASTYLHYRTLDDPTVRPIEGTEGAILPFFSPDGNWMGFFSGRDPEIHKMLLPGGASNSVISSLGGNSDVEAGVASGDRGSRGAAWLDDGSIGYSPTSESPLFRVPGDTQQAIQITRLEQGERSHRWPVAVPGENIVLFTVETEDDRSFDEARIEALDLKSMKRVPVLEGGSYPGYLPSGHLLYVSGGKLLAVPFDAATLSTSGAPVVVSESVLYHAPSGSAAYAVSASGALAIVPDYLQIEYDVVRRLKDGSVETLWRPERPIDSIRASPDGLHLALVMEREIWLYNLDRQVTVPLTNDMNVGGGLTWSADGQKLAFSAQPRGLSAINLFWMWAFSDEPPERFPWNDDFRWAGSWVKSGLIAFEEADDLYVYDTLGENEPRAVATTAFKEAGPALSPDGRLLAYSSDESGRFEVFVRLLEGSSRKQRVSTYGGFTPTWSSDGKELYYLNEQGLRSVTIGSGPTLTISQPRTIESEVAGSSFTWLYNRTYDLLPEGDAIVMLRPRQQLEAPSPIVTLNWFQEINRLVPRDN